MGNFLAGAVEASVVTSRCYVLGQPSQLCATSRVADPWHQQVKGLSRCFFIDIDTDRQSCGRSKLRFSENVDHW